MNQISERIFHRLNKNFVEIDTEQFVEINDQLIKLNIPKLSVSYVNSPSGRERLQKEQPENIVLSVLSFWGDQPTIEDETL